MKIYQAWQDFRRENPQVKLNLALGNFDGFHLGHRCLLAKMQEACQKEKASSGVFLFHPHPLSKLCGTAPSLLNNDMEKEALLRYLGIDYLIYQEFTQIWADMLPQEFVSNILVEKLQVNHLFVGFNYTFGAKAAGETKLLARLAQQHGFLLTVSPPVKQNGMIVSSSVIRQALQSGNLQKANALLGYAYCFSGQVVKGKQLGRQLGFPTANLICPKEKQKPVNGVYRIAAACEGQLYDGVANIGKQPTISDHEQHFLEAHLFDTNEDFYGKLLWVWLLDFIRPEQKFANVVHLQKQISQDKKTAKALMEKRPIDRNLLLPKTF